MATGRIARAAIGIVVSLVAIVLVAGSVDLETTGEALAAADIEWLPIIAGLIGLDVLVRAIRWQRLLEPIRHVAFGPVLGALLVGYLANNVLPARLGELLRSHYLGDRERLSRTTTLGTVVVERVIDTAVVVAIAALAIVVLNVRGVVRNAVAVGIAIVILLAAPLAVSIAGHRLPGAERLARRAERWPRLALAIGRLRGGLAVAGRPRTLVEALGLSVLAWGATLLAFIVAGSAVGLELRVSDAALLSSGVALASAIPSGPGYLGTYELAAVKVAEAIGLAAAPALATAVIVHVAILLVTSIGGLVALQRFGWQLRVGAADQVSAD
ncbi:MAG: flippase-like domain-containing protein [Chloroflexota bacterium]|nr:MAG: flippase-like domain-containing protein [Chloroflexota bacterium]